MSTEGLVVFSLDGQRYALPLPHVERIVRMVEITPLPTAPDVVLGLINAHGQIIPVFNLRRRFHLPERELALNDRLIISHASKRAVALAVEAEVDVIEAAPENIVPTKELLSRAEYVPGVLKLEDGMVLIHDLDTFLSAAESESLKNALKKNGYV